MKSLSPYNSGNKFLVEDCQRVSISAYHRKAMEKLKGTLIATEIEMGNLSVELIPSRTAFNGIRYWLKCPKCSRRVGVLFVHPLKGELGCRKCLNLEYKSRRYKGMVEMQLGKPNKDKPRSRGQVGWT